MLKKCIVIMVMFALVAGAAFAQITIGGQLQEAVTLLSGSNEKDSDILVGNGYKKDTGPYSEAKVSVLFGDGTAGGRLVLYAKGGMWGWMQWRPNQYFRIKIGSDGDGEWGFPQIVGWGFTGEAKNGVGAVSDYGGLGSGKAISYRNAGLNYGGFDGDGRFNLGISIFPIDLLQINFLFKQITGNSSNEGDELSKKLAQMHIIASYRIEEVGTIRFLAAGSDVDGNNGGGLAKDAADGTQIGLFMLAFHSNELVQGLGFEIGGKFDLPHVNSDQYSPTSVAAGLNLTMFDPFGLKIRTNINFGGKTAAGEDIKTTQWGIGLLPSYKLPKMTIFLHAGLGIEAKEDEDPTYDWFINPYIWVPMGGMRMWVGFIVQDDGGRRALDDQVGLNWAIPFGFNFYF
jgi:hypothetical protein